MRQDLAFLFPGQGSQRSGMLHDAAAAFPEVSATFEEAADALGFDLWSLIQSDDADTLNLTEFTQPALLTSSVALWRAWLANDGQKPAAMAGHSLGEFSALCCSGVLALSDAVRLVRERGRFMQTAVPVGEGAMAAVIGLDDDVVIHACTEVAKSDELVVEPVNFNSPGQVVIAGVKAAVDRVSDRLRDAGARRVLPLPVSAPFHTSLMQPAGEKLAAVMSAIEFRAPQIAVINNVYASIESNPQKIRELLVKQISAPVRWTECMQTLQGLDVSRFVECGAGRVLGGLLRRIDKSLSCDYLEQPEGFFSARDALA